MFIVGVTGGIGSGKTAATDEFVRLGITIVDADVASRIVVEPGTPGLAAIAEHFGPELLLADGTLNRAAMRQRIFSNPEEKQWLESLLHPLIGNEIRRQLACSTSPYSILVSPLLIETTQATLCDRIVVVDADEDTQLARTVTRDNNDEAQVRRIIAAQAQRQDRLAAADDIIDNSTTIESLIHQVRTLHDQFIQLANEKAKAEP